MKILVLMLIFTIVSCSTNPSKKYQSIPRDSVTKIKDLVLVNHALADFLKFAQKDILILRGKTTEKSQHVILEWKKIKGTGNGHLWLRILKADGEDYISSRKKITYKAFKRFLIGKTNKIFLKKKVMLVNLSSPNNQMISGGTFEQQFKIKLVKGSFSDTIILKHQIRIASLNALQLWDANPNNTANEQLYIYNIFRKPFSNWYKKRVQKTKAKNIAKQIRLAGLPEVVAFQEIESARNRSEVFKKGTPLRNSLEKLGYSKFIIGKQESDNPVALTTAFASRLRLRPHEGIKFNVNLPYFKNHFSKKERHIAHYTTRDMQVVELAILDSKALIINNHWRSQGCKRPRDCEFSENVRITSAKVVRDWVSKHLKQNPDHDVIIVGDMNSPYNKEPMGYLGSIGDESFVQDAVMPDYFYNFWYELPVNKRWEVSHKGQYENLSHILVGRNLYDNQGLQYVDNSFEVIGQSGVARDILLSADGNPFRWQQTVHPLKDVSKKIAREITQIMDQRKCRGPKDRRCWKSYVEYSGDGYGDHLPLVADFRIVGGKKDHKGQTSYHPSSTGDLNTIPMINTSYVECADNDRENYPSITNINLKNKKWFGKCLRLDPASPLSLQTFGVYNSGCVNIKGVKLGIILARSFDPRPFVNGVIDDNNPSKMHSQSNMFFTRKILQGKGGKVKSAFGRLAMLNGILTLYISRREHIKLSDLPSYKLKNY